MNFQSIIGFLTSPFGIVILIGTFSTLGRMFKSAQEQQAKKSALAEMRKAQRDALRTGSSPQAADPVQTMATKSAAIDQGKQTRQDRIEQLRAQRVEQLKKLRERRSGGQTQSSSNLQNPTRPNQSHAQPKRVSRPGSSVASPASPARTPTPAPQPYAQQAPKKATQKAPRPAQATPFQTTPRRRSRPKPVAAPSQRASDESRRVTRTKPDSPIVLGSTPTQDSGAGSTRAHFRKNIRQAIIAKEILSTPIGLRSPGSESTGIL